MATVDMQGMWNPGEQYDYDPTSGGYQQQPSATSSQLQSAPTGLPNPPKPGGAMFDGDLIGSPEYISKIEAQLKAAGGQMYDPSDLQGFIRNATNNQGEGWAGSGTALQNQLDIYKQRDPTNSYGLRAGEPVGSGGGGGGATSQAAPRGQFTDPLASALEAFANQRARDLQNPPGGSGQAMLEELLKKISAQFQNGGFTPGEQEVFQTQAIDPLERLRTARKQQVMQELSRRGITPSSGVAQSMLADVDRQFDAQRATTQRGIAAQGAQETQQRMLQAVQLLSQLQGTQEGRMDKAGQYLNVPINLADRAWNQSFQLYNANNPLSLINPLMQLSGQQQQRTDQQGAAMADLIWALINGMGQ
jgi:hypothetical protein